MVPRPVIQTNRKSLLWCQETRSLGCTFPVSGHYWLEEMQILMSPLKGMQTCSPILFCRTNKKHKRNLSLTSCLFLAISLLLKIILMCFSLSVGKVISIDTNLRTCIRVNGRKQTRHAAVVLITIKSAGLTFPPSLCIHCLWEKI